MTATTTSRVNIYGPDNKLIINLPITPGCRRRVQLMTEDSITVRFSDPRKLQFPVGSRIGDFYITGEQQEKYNAVTGGYDYELKFDAYYWLWANKLLFYAMPGVTDAPKETSFRLTATIETHAQVICNALDALGFRYKGSPFGVEPDKDFSTEVKYISYADMSVLGGIQAIAEAYGCEWWVKGNKIHFGRCSDKGEYELTVGDNVASITSDSRETQANRLIVFGSDRNLPADYRRSGSSDSAGGVVVRRLMLPEGKRWLQTADVIPENEIVEKEVVLEDVYPRTALTVTDVDVYEVTDKEGKTHTYYRIKYGDAFPFSQSYKLPDTDEFHVVFESGLLNGMDFTVKFNPLGVAEKLDGNVWNPEAQMFEIVAAEDYGRTLPDTMLHPECGDSFSLYGWDTSKMNSLGLVAKAEAKLLDEGMKLLEEYRKDLHTYTCPMMWDWCKAQADSGNSPSLGSVVNLHFVPGDAGRKSRIIGYEHDLDIEYSNVTYICGEKVSVSRLKTLEGKVEGLVHDGSRLRVQNSLDFLSKRHSDRTPYALGVGGLLTAENGAQGAGYISGMGGSSWGVDPVGNMSVESINVRSFMRVMELIVNRQRIEDADSMLTEGDTIESVEELTGAAGTLRSFKLRLREEWEGYRTAQVVNNVLRGVYNDIAGKLGNTQEPQPLNGVTYATSWMKVTKVEAERNEITVTLYADADCPAAVNFAPVPGMKVARWGNSGTDRSRQRLIYLSSTEGRIVMRDQVTKPIVDDRNLAVCLGTVPEFLVNAESGVSAGDYALYVKTLVAERIVKRPYSGLPEPELRYRGPYDPSARYYDGTELREETGDYERSIVSDRSGRWACNKASGTDAEGNVVNTAPSPDSTAWTLIEAAIKGDKGDRGEPGANGTNGKDGRNGADYSPNLLAGTLAMDGVGYGTDYQGTNHRSSSVSDGVRTFSQLCDYVGRMGSWMFLTALVDGGTVEDVFAAGREVTVSLECRSTAPFRMYLSTRSTAGGTNHGAVPNTVFAADASWHRVQATGVCTTQAGDDRLLFGINLLGNSPAGSWLEFRKVCVSAGRQGQWVPAASEMEGKDGEDAVSIQVSPQTLLCNEGETTTVNVYVDLYHGTRRVAYGDVNDGNFGCSLLVAGASNGWLLQNKVRWNGFGTTADGRFHYTILVTSRATGVDLEVPFTVNYGGKSYPQAFTVRTVPRGPQGHVGAYVPPPRPYSDYADGYVFLDGKTDVTVGGVTHPGRERVDVVLVWDSAGNHYVPWTCVKSHALDRSLTPSSSGWGTYWESDGGTWTQIATQVLLAQNAYIDLLSSRGIRVYDSGGNIVGALSSAQDTKVAGDIFLPFWLGGVMNQDGTFATNPNFGIGADGTIYCGGFNTGRRIRISGADKRMQVFDNSGREVVTIEGTAHPVSEIVEGLEESFRTKAQLTPETWTIGTGYAGDTRTVTVELGEMTIPAGGGRYETAIEAVLSAQTCTYLRNSLPGATGGTVNTYGHITSTARVELGIYDKDGKRVAHSEAQLSGTVDASDKLVGIVPYELRRRVLVAQDLTAGKYKVKAVYSLTKSSATSFQGAQVYAVSSAANVPASYHRFTPASDGQRSMLGSDGLVVSKSPLHFMRTGMVTDIGFVAEAQSEGFGMRVTPHGLQTRTGGNPWQSAPVTLCAGKINMHYATWEVYGADCCVSASGKAPQLAHTTDGDLEIMDIPGLAAGPENMFDPRNLVVQVTLAEPETESVHPMTVSARYDRNRGGVLITCRDTGWGKTSWTNIWVEVRLFPYAVRG